MEKIDKNKVFFNNICSLCENKNNCTFDKVVNQKFYNGISTTKCRDYKYKKEVGTNE